MCVLARTLLAVFGHDHQRLGAGHQRSILLAAALAVACGPADHPQRPLRVAAASSLTNVLPTLVRELGLEPAELRFEASSTLARQIEAGDEVDVFLSADARWADHLIEVGLADPADRTAFASNRLVVVVPRDESSLPTRLGDLRALPHVAVAGPDVPAGRLAREALAHEAVLVDADGWLVDAPNVRGALAWVALGEAEAAIVFQTDAQIEPAVRLVTGDERRVLRQQPENR